MAGDRIANDKLPVLFVVSDGRGETCSQVLQAALCQFEGQDFQLVIRPNIRTVEQITAVLQEAADREGTVFYTLVAHEVRWALSQLAGQLMVPTVDILGSSFSALHDVFQREPSEKPGLFYASDRERFDRQKAIDYTLKHDDGQRPDELHLADVVLVGVSRAAKSTTCFYLAFQGIKAANVPLVFGTPVSAPAGHPGSQQGDRPVGERHPADDGPAGAGHLPRRTPHRLLHRQAGSGQRGAPRGQPGQAEEGGVPSKPAIWRSRKSRGKS